MNTLQRKNLDTLLKNPTKTSNVLDLILKETKQMKYKVYEEVFKGFEDKKFENYKDKLIERKRLKEVAERIIQLESILIEQKYFKTL
jgi:hypothetical protein